MAYQTRKTSVKSIIRDPDKHARLLELVLRVNSIAIDTYHFIRLYCLDQYRIDAPQPELTSEFIYHCMIVLTQSTRKVAQKNELRIRQLTDFYNTHFQPLFNHQKVSKKDLGQILNYSATLMETCYSVNLKEHFIKRLMRFVTVTTMGGDKVLVRQLKTALKLNDATLVPAEYQEWYDKYRAELYPLEINKSIAYDCECRPFAYIKHSIFINSHFETMNLTLADDKKMRLFQPISLRNSLIPKYITLDTHAICDVFKLSKLKDDKHEIWSKIFDLDAKIFRANRYQFNFTLQTDGVGASLLFCDKTIKPSKAKKVAAPVPYIEPSSVDVSMVHERTIVGCDPNKSNLLFMVDSCGNKLRYTKAQRDAESYAKKGRRTRLKMKALAMAVTAAETELTQHTHNTVDFAKFCAYIQAKHVCSERVAEYYADIVHRKINWRTKVYRQKSVDNFINKIATTFGSNPIITIGDWSNPQGSCIRGPSTINIGLKRVVEKRYTTFLVDEYNTSKKCCNCGTTLEKIEANWSLLKCKNCTQYIDCPEDKNDSMCRYNFYNRDYNSALNILAISKHIIYHHVRPRLFERIRNLQPPVMDNGCTSH